MGRKIKYQGGITKLICQRKAELHKAAFKKEVFKSNRFFNYSTSNKVNFDVISFSGAGSFEDQLLSIYSFVFYAGIPINWTIYSDHSYTPEQIAIFAKEFPFVVVKNWDTNEQYLDNKYLNEYAKICPLYKKINLIISHQSEHQVIYADSDIVFYKNIAHYFKSELLEQNLWYVPDALGNVEKHFNAPQSNIYPLNSGLLFINKNFNSDDIFKYLEGLNGNYGYFSEQSSFEYAFRRQNAQLLDPRQFVIDSSDQFDFSTKYNPADIAMRHYTSPVRHKMWQNGWKWHFLHNN